MHSYTHSMFRAIRMAAASIAQQARIVEATKVSITKKKKKKSSEAKYTDMDTRKCNGCCHLQC